MTLGACKTKWSQYIAIVGLAIINTCSHLMLFFLCVANSLLVAVVDKVLKNESFHLPSPCATATISAARVVSAWIKENNSTANKFEKDLVSSLTNCLEQPKVKSANTNRERMWRAYHQLRTSGGYMGGIFTSSWSYRKM